MAVNGKQKGNAFEREAAKLMSDLLGMPVRRVPQSGAFGTLNAATLMLHESKTLVGDLIMPEEFRFAVECKSYKSFLWHHTENKQLDKWIQQAKKDAALANKEMMVLFKIVRQGIWVVLDKDSWDDIKKSDPKHLIKYNDHVIMSWDNFTKNISVNKLFVSGNRKIQKRLDI